MNERLKELEKQSIITIETREISSAWDNDRPPYRYITITETKFSPEKFAELVVKECAKVGRSIGGINVSNAINKHFGIE